MNHITIPEVVSQLAQRAGISLDQAKLFLQAQAELAYEQARDGFPIPGIGVLAVTDRPERKLVMRFGRKQGQEVTVTAKKVLQFRVAKIAMDTVFGPPTTPPNVLEIELFRDDDWKETWNARETALKSVLGETDGDVLHATMPFHMGGQADVLCFRQHIPGRVFATCELLGEPGQKRNQLGTFELMIAHRDDSNWGSNVISRLARYTCDAQLEPGHTMDLGSLNVPKGSTIAAFLFVAYTRFEFRGKDAGLLLCIGVTPDELAACRQGKQQQVLEALKAAGVYPYTDLFRPSVLKSAKVASDAG